MAGEADRRRVGRRIAAKSPDPPRRHCCDCAAAICCNGCAFLWPPYCWRRDAAAIQF